MRKLARPIFAPLVAVCSAVCVGGCTADGDDPSSVRQRQDSALKDPFSYGPAVPSPGGRAAANSGGNANAPHPDDSAKSEWDRFWNP